MAHVEERDNGANSFLIGLLAGTVVGAGLGLLFAPKTGSELRNQISEQAEELGKAGSEGYRRAAEGASELAEKGRQAYGKVREVVAATRA